MNESITPINLVLDTNVFNVNKYSFETNGFYTTLKQMISQNKIKLYLSCVVVEEVRAHFYSEIIKKIDDAYKDIEKIRNCFPECIFSPLGFPEKPKPDKKMMDDYFDNFISELNADIMPYSDVTIEQLFTDYFEMKPPFEEKKKAEFPDSVIFHQIIKRFNDDNPVLVLSKDEGFISALDAFHFCTVYREHKELFDYVSSQYKDYDLVHSDIKNNLHDLTTYFLEHQSELISNLKISIPAPNRFDPDYSVEYNIDYGTLALIDNDKTPIRIVNFDDKTANVSLFLNFNSSLYFHYKYHEKYKEEHQLHKCGCWVDFVWNRELKKVEKCSMDYTFRFPTMTSRSRENAEIIGLCPDCGKSITIHNDGGNGFCIDCAQNH